MEINFRVYNFGDEEGIVELLKTCFKTFNTWDITSKDWVTYEEEDYGFKKENALVAELNGKIIGHVQIMHRRIRIGHGILDCCGIANVSTHPNYRGKGIATKLIQMALEICRKRGWHISSLFTGYGSEGYRVYRKIGYANTTFINEYLGIRENVEKVLSKIQEKKLEKFEMEISHLKEVMRLHENYSFKINGYCERDEKYWEKKVFEKTYYQSFFHECKNAGVRLMMKDNDEAIGYSLTLNTLKASRSKWQDKLAFIMEAVSRDKHEMKIILRETLEKLLKEDFKVFRLRIPVDEELMYIMRYFEEVKGALYMDYILDQRRLFESIKVELEKRLKEDPVGEKIETNISIISPYGEISMEISGGEIEIVDGNVENKIKLTRDGLSKLIYGVKSFQEIVGDDRFIEEIKICNKAFKAMKIMFPKRIFQISPIDEW